MPPLPRHYMIRDISQYLADTVGMSPLEAFAFNNLEIAYWLMGALPNNPERLAFIAQIPLDAWPMHEHRVMHAFVLCLDGHLHHHRARKLRDEDRAKSLKRTEHARRAAMFRWHREEMEKEGEIQAKIEHARASIEHETNNVTTSLAGSPSRALPFLDPFVKGTDLGAREDNPAAPAAGAELGGWKLVVDGQHRSVIKAKPWKSGIRARREAGEDLTPIKGRASVLAALRTRRKVVSSGRSEGKNKPPATDARFELFKGKIFEMWEQVNPHGPSCTWQEKDREALATVLREHLDLTAHQFDSCVGNVAESIREKEISPTAAPRCWLDRIVEYLSCPLDRYRKPLRKPGERSKAPPRQF